MSMPTLSLCMIVKNEEKNLERCLRSVQGLVDEIVIVDTGSTDGTLAIAKRFQVKLFETIWPGDFSRARNMSLEQAAGEWILVLDADEELDQAAQSQLKGILANTQAAGLRLRQRNLLSPNDLMRYHDIPIIRVFRKDAKIRFEGLIHESVLDSVTRQGGSIEDTELIILHSGYSQRVVQGSGSRGERNLDLLLKMLAANPEDTYIYYQLGITYKQLGRSKEARFYLTRMLTMDTIRLTPAILGEGLMKLAQLDLAENQENDCILHAEASLKYDADNPICFYLIALAYMASGLVEKAYPYFVRIRQSATANLKDIEKLETVMAYCRQVLRAQG
ncbi:MAG: glycosyltransferase [Anaerolineaceae bacterium]|nr:glycosyltransferase [Anaerolineaceae bacterium]